MLKCLSVLCSYWLDSPILIYVYIGGVFQKERLVLILVSVGAAVIVLVAIVSAVLVVKRGVYRTRWVRHTHSQHAAFTLWVQADDCGFCRMPAYRFSNLRIQDDNNGITAEIGSAASSNGTACQNDSDVVRVLQDSFGTFSQILIGLWIKNVIFTCSLICLCSCFVRIFSNDAWLKLKKMLVIEIGPTEEKKNYKWKKHENNNC